MKLTNANWHGQSSNHTTEKHDTEWSPVARQTNGILRSWCSFFRITFRKGRELWWLKWGMYVNRKTPVSLGLSWNLILKTKAGISHLVLHAFLRSSWPQLVKCLSEVETQCTLSMIRFACKSHKHEGNVQWISRSDFSGNHADFLKGHGNVQAWQGPSLVCVN
jgi:hypothetical protein